MPPVDTAAQLRSGDVLLYKPNGIFGWIIRLKTWHAISHVECYIGNGVSVASRDGIGVNKYPLRLQGLTTVCRPVATLQPRLSWTSALRWFDTMKGTPYGWADLLQFAGLNVDGSGIICSTFVARFCRRLGYDPFNGEDPNKVAPFQFELSDCYDIYEVSDDGKVTSRSIQVVDSAS